MSRAMGVALTPRGRYVGVSQEGGFRASRSDEGGNTAVKEHTEKVKVYTPPAIERREDVKALLGATRGSYCLPKTFRHHHHR
jgi:hypothetical protein